MPAWSFASLRPQLDRFFGSVRTALEARADAGVDRRRLEDFLVQTRSLQTRLYACLERDDRSDLADILKEIQVLAYRTRVLFGSPLPGVAWDDVQTLLTGLPAPAAPPAGPSRVLEAAPRAAFASGDLKDSRRAAVLPERTLIASVPARFTVGTPPPEAPEAVEREDPAPEALAPAPEPPPPESPDALLAAEPPPEEEPGDPVPVDPVPGAETAPAAWALPRWPLLTGVLIALLGAIAGYSLGGIHPLLTAIGCGILALLATRP